MSRFICYYTIFLFFFSSNALTKSIVVTADQFERVYLDSTSSIELITREQIEKSNADSIIDLLRTQVGLSIPTNGPYGKASSVQIRGADSRHTLVLIDGVRATDVTSISGGARLEFLGLDQVESIEILRGSQSVLYGSEAIGGVLKITTLKPQYKSFKVKAGYGTYNNRVGSASIQGKEEVSDFTLSYTLAAGLQSVDGISAFNAKKSVSADEDGLSQSNLLGKFVVEKKKHSLSFGVQKTYSHYDFDDATADNPTSVGVYEDLQLFTQYNYKKNRILNLKLNITQKEVERDLSGENSFGRFNYIYKGSFKRFEAMNLMSIIHGGETIIGIEAERESVDALDSKLSKVRTRERVASYINHYQKINNFLFELGVRTEKFQGFSDKNVYRSSVGYRLGKFTLKGSFATGFKAPSLYQSFNTFAVSKNLSYEESKSSEVGLLYISPNTLIELTAFEVSYDGFIDFDSPLNSYVNRGNFLQRGLELSIEREYKGWALENTYTFLNSKNTETNEGLVRRPKHKVSSSGVYNLTNDLNLGGQFDYIGKRDEVNNQKLPPYWTFGLLAMKRLRNYQMKFTINNIFDQEYEEVLNFPARGRNFLISFTGEWK